MRASNALADVTSDLQVENPQAHVVVDRDKASALGVTAQAVESALYSAYGQRLVSPIYTSNNQYWVVMQVQERFQSDPDMLSELYIHSSRGELVPLSAVSKFTTGVGPLTVNHTGQLPSVTISFNLKPGVALGEAVNEIRSISSSTLPISIAGSFQGTAQAFQQSLTGLGILLIATVALIYIVLGILYESFIHPITILTGLPAAAFGGLATLSLFHMPLDIYGFVGLIMLIGIVKKNAIMMVDVAIEGERNEGKEPEQAIFDACLLRFRPIMMTTMAAMLGALPLALGTNVGSELRRPMGIAIVGGLLFSQVLTLYTTPVIYLYMDRLQIRIRGRKERPIEGLSGELGHPSHA
jgi:HAE1 family hydrophobic/amphiphilic exporter-1